MRNAEFGLRSAPAYANLLRQGYGGQEASAGRPAYAEASAGREWKKQDKDWGDKKYGM